MAKLSPTLDLKATAGETKTFEGAGDIKKAKELLRLMLAYYTCGISQRTTAASAQWKNRADVADVAVLKRIRVVF